MPSPDRSPTVQGPPLWLRAANWTLSAVSRARAGGGLLDAEQLERIASRKTGLRDFGDPMFRTGLQTLVKSLNDDVSLTPVGRMVMRQALAGYLANRLKVRDAVRRIPSITGSPVTRPLFIVGLSRTGTTMLHNLLALAPDTRAPRTWELLQSAPPCPPGDPGTRRRYAKARRLLRLLYFAAPDFRIVHPIDVADAEECYPLLNHTFVSPAFGMHYGVPGYWEWVTHTPHDVARWAYEEYRSQLQVLQWGHPERRWILKSAVHLLSLPALLQVFPDALIVQTHRDLTRTLPSLCSMLMCFRNLLLADCAPHTLGQECLVRAQLVLEQGAAALTAVSPSQRLHVGFEALVRDPVAEVRKIHDHFGLGWSAILESSIKKWVAQHPPHLHGRHRYSLAQFGLDENTIRSRLPENLISGQL